MTNIYTKQILRLILAICLILPLNAHAQNYRSQQNRAFFPVENCLNIGNGLDAPNEGDWGYSFDEQDFYAIKSRGFDTVRIMIKWSAHSDLNSPYLIDARFLRRVDQIITWGLNSGLNIIIDVHNYDELYSNPDAHEPRLIAIWAQIASHYRNAPPNLIFEIINEPQDKFSGERVNRTQFAALNAIRQTNPTRSVILAGDNWGDIGGMDNLRLPNDPYVIPTVHYYGPFEFTHQGATWMGENAPPTGRAWPIQNDIAGLNADITKIYEWQSRMGRRVFIGEYGTDDAVPMNYRIDWAKDVTTGFKRAGFATCYNNFASGFSIYDKPNHRWNDAIVNAILGNYR